MRRSVLAIVVLVGMVAAACGTRVTDDQSTTFGVGSPSIPTADFGTGAETETGEAADVAAGDEAATRAVGSTATPDAIAATPAAGGASASSGTQAPAAASTKSDPGVTDTEIRIGATGPLSGIVGFLGEEAFGAIDSYFQSVNAKGGVNGRKLRLITYDDRFEASQTLANVRRLYEQDKVVALYLAFGDAVGDYVTRNNIPTLVFGVTPLSFASKYPTVFPLVGNALLWTQEVIAGLKSKGVFKEGMRVGMLYDTQILDVRPYVPYLKEAWENEGATVVSTDAFNLSDGDCTSLVLKMKELNIDYWDFQGLGWVLCASAAARQQYRPNIGWGNWPTSVGGLSTQVGPWIEGIWGGSQGDRPDGKPREKTAAHDEYVNAIKRYHPEIASLVHYESPATIGYWSGAKLLVAALQAQGKGVTKAGINDWISKVENFDVGITPPIISMAPTCKTGSEVVWIAQWKWDAANKQAVREPETGYFTSSQKDRYGGKCFLTKLSDQMT